MVEREEIEMSWGARAGSILLAVFLALGLTFGASATMAATGDIIAPSDPDHPSPESGWQAGTCNFDTPTCDVESPSDQFFEAAGGHPPVGFTQFIVKHEPPGESPVGELKTVRVDLPPGLTVNPQATPQCAQAAFEADPESCPEGSEVGESLVTASVAGVPTPVPSPPVVYNIAPPEGQPARFGFNLLGNNIYLEADVAWDSDFHEGFTIHVPETPFAKALELGFPLLQGGAVLKNRLVFDGRSGDGTFITTPTTCLGEATPSSPFRDIYSTWLLASSIEEEEQPGYVFPDSARPPFESRIPPGTSPKDCSSVPFDPSVTVDPGTSNTDSPAGATVTAALPEIEGGENQASSHVRSARVTLPPGMGINPSAAEGLEACTDAQFGKGTRNPVACPAASRIGTVEIDTPPLPDGSLTGPVYVGQQLSRDPTSGDEYRIFVDVESPRYGISARLLGKIVADPETGQLTNVFEDGALGSVSLPGLPQVPFKFFRIKLNGGPRATLTSPPTCGPNTTAGRFTPWTSAVGIVAPGGEEGPSTAPPATPSGDFTLTAAPGGGACPKTLGERPFDPSFAAGTAGHQAGAFSPLQMDIGRSDGNQELKGVDVTLPPGLTAKLKGVHYCPEPVLAAAAGISGSDEAAHSSCPDASLIGKAEVAAGSGPAPVHITGKVFLAGPYKGAPLSLAVVTPATAGPFDLGTVVVRVALFVDPRTAQVRAQSDPIPHVYGGATLDIRSIAVKLDRHEFSLNPTSCSPGGFGGSLLGGGANPTDPGAFSSKPVSAAFSTNGCEKLGFKPKIFFRLFGATRRGKNPRLRAVVVPHPGDANFARAATILPRSLILDQGNLSKVCTRVQFAADACPKNSIYGYARAFSPLLDKPLQGPVYLRSSDNLLPDLVSDLRGQVEIELDSRTDSVHGHIRNIFDLVPDVPVSKFILTLRGGKKGLLVNSRNQCPRHRGHRGRKGGKNAHRSLARRGGTKHKGKKHRRGQRVLVHFKGQNGKKRNLRQRLRVPCGKHHRHRQHRRR